MYFTEEQIKTLEEMKADYHFTTIIQSAFKRGTSLAYDNEVANIYEKATGKKIERNWNCKACAFNTYKQIAQLYFQSKKHYEEEEKKAEKEITDFVDDIISTDKKIKEKKKITKNTTKKITKKK